MRVVVHSGRGSAKHNDRSFDTSRAEHIADERTMGNREHMAYRKLVGESKSFEEHEAKLYSHWFGEYLEARNQRVAKRHPERVMTIYQYLHSKRTRPEELLLQVGKSGDTVDPDILEDVVMELMRWVQAEFPQVKPLDFALHQDEQGAPHIHWREVWIAHDKEGHQIVGQTKALEEMGIQRPNPDRPEGRYNNAKITYTNALREKFQQLCLEHELEIEIEPRHHSRSGRDLIDYQAENASLRLQKARRDLSDVLGELESLGGTPGLLDRLHALEELEDFCKTIYLDDEKTVFDRYQEEKNQNPIISWDLDDR